MGFFSQFFVAPEREKPESEQHFLTVEGGPGRDAAGTVDCPGCHLICCETETKREKKKKGQDLCKRGTLRVNPG